MPRSHQATNKEPVGFEAVSGSVEETQACGERVGRLLRPGDVVALYGALGSGKTTLIQGIAQGLRRDPEAIKSPTFVLMREYPGEVPLIHIDGYRLEDTRAVSWLDLDLMFSPRKVTVIEWAERFVGCLPADYLEIRLAHKTTNQRSMTIIQHGARSAEMVAALKHDDPRD